MLKFDMFNSLQEYQDFLKSFYNYSNLVNEFNNSIKLQNPIRKELPILVSYKFFEENDSKILTDLNWITMKDIRNHEKSKLKEKCYISVNADFKKTGIKIPISSDFRKYCENNDVSYIGFNDDVKHLVLTAQIPSTKNCIKIKFYRTISNRLIIETNINFTSYNYSIKYSGYKKEELEPYYKGIEKFVEYAFRDTKEEDKTIRIFYKIDSRGCATIVEDPIN